MIEISVPKIELRESVSLRIGSDPVNLPVSSFRLVIFPFANLCSEALFFPYPHFSLFMLKSASR